MPCSEKSAGGRRAPAIAQHPGSFASTVGVLDLRSARRSASVLSQAVALTQKALAQQRATAAKLSAAGADMWSAPTGRAGAVARVVHVSANLTTAAVARADELLEMLQRLAVAGDKATGVELSQCCGALARDLYDVASILTVAADSAAKMHVEGLLDRRLSTAVARAMRRAGAGAKQCGEILTAEAESVLKARAEEVDHV